MPKGKRAKATAIPKKVKDEVWERDEHKSIFSGNPNAFPEMHYVSRQNGGKGIPENIITGTRTEHELFDRGSKETKEYMRRKAKEYLKTKYPEWDEVKLVYKKYDFL